jgi:hypothetical protein
VPGTPRRVRADVEQPPGLLAQVGVDVGLVVAGEQRPALRHRDRVDIDVDDSCRRGCALGDLVHVPHGRDAEAEIEELPDPGLDEEPHCPVQKCAVCPRHSGQSSIALVICLAITEAQDSESAGRTWGRHWLGRRRDHTGRARAEWDR